MRIEDFKTQSRILTERLVDKAPILDEKLVEVQM